MPYSAYGVNLTPPAPISYSVPTNIGDISSILKSVNKAQNDANVANNQRYDQMLGVLSNGNTQARNDLSSGYQSALGDLSGSLANNNTVFSNEQNRAIQDAMKASAQATNSGISRGLGNTTIMNSMQDQVQRAKNDAFSQIAANKAQADNAVYKNISDIHQNQANSLANQSMQGSNSIANAIQSRNDVGPSISDYASLISNAAQAQNSNGKSVITTVDPIPINSPLRTGGTQGTGGIGASMGDYSSGTKTNSDGSSTYTSPTGGQVFYGPNAQNNPANAGNNNSDTYTPPEMAPVSIAPSDLGKPVTMTPEAPPTDASAIMPDSNNQSLQDYLARVRQLGIAPNPAAIAAFGGNPAMA